jgi:hypothetical protein
MRVRGVKIASCLGSVSCWSSSAKIIKEDERARTVLCKVYFKKKKKNQKEICNFRPKKEMLLPPRK